MLKTVAQKLTIQMVRYDVVDAAKGPVYTYGFELMLSSLAGVLVLITISLVLRAPFLWIPYLAGFIPIRLLGGGYHAKTHSACISAFSLLYISSLIAEQSHLLPSWFPLFSCILNISIMLLFAPVVSPNKPLRETHRIANRHSCLLLGALNLGFSVLWSFTRWSGHWFMMYFAGSCMAGFSMLLAVVNKKRKG